MEHFRRFPPEMRTNKRVMEVPGRWISWSSKYSHRSQVALQSCQLLARGTRTGFHRITSGPLMKNACLPRHLLVFAVWGVRWRARKAEHPYAPSLLSLPARLLRAHPWQASELVLPHPAISIGSQMRWGKGNVWRLRSQASLTGFLVLTLHLVHSWGQVLYLSMLQSEICKTGKLAVLTTLKFF